MNEKLQTSGDKRLLGIAGETINFGLRSKRSVRVDDPLSLTLEPRREVGIGNGGPIPLQMHVSGRAVFVSVAKAPRDAGTAVNTHAIGTLPDELQSSLLGRGVWTDGATRSLASAAHDGQYQQCDDLPHTYKNSTNRVFIQWH